MLLQERINLAHSAVMREDWDSAWLILRDALNEDSENPAGIYLLALCLRAQGHLAAAMQLLRRVLAIAPNKTNVWMHYGACLHDLTRFDEAREAFLVVNKELPNDPVPIANIAAGYSQMGRASSAIEWANRALAIDKTSRIARIAKGFSSLSIGRWSDGWDHLSELYGESLTVRIYNPPGREEPDWDGSHGKTVVVQCDQGVGDQIMFSQCINDLKRVSKKVIVECAARMVTFFENNFNVETHGTLKQKYADWPASAGIDFHTHISFLGKWFRNNDSDFPRVAYIKPDGERVGKWKEWLQKFQRPWAGIAWRGGIPITGKASRSVELAEYEPIINQVGTFFDLSYDDSGLEVSTWNIDHNKQIVIPPIDKNNFEDTIALVAALDDIVTVTTTLAHVCGAIGRHAYVIVPAVPQWRYAYRVDDENGVVGRGVIWYPRNSIRLYRQSHGDGSFKHTIKRISVDMSNVRALRAA